MKTIGWSRRCERGSGRSLPVVVGDLSRRRFLAGAGGLLLLGAAGCSGGRGAGQGETSDGSRVIEHNYGSTEVSGMPGRVVTVGLTEQDYVLALGVSPVGVREWFGQYPGALWPWALERLGEDPLPEVLPVEELNFEQIATLGADLILGINSGLTEEEYGTLSEIAPTVAQPAGYADYGAPWQEITRSVGRALGVEDRAEGLIPEVEARFEEVRSRLSQFEGSTGLLASSIDGAAYVYAEGPAPSFLTFLGLELPEATAELFSGDEERAPVQLSLERVELLEADLLLMGLYGPEEGSVASESVYRQLATVREGRDILMPELSLVNGALSFGSVLSLPIALDEMLPRMRAALDGDPETEPEPLQEA